MESYCIQAHLGTDPFYNEGRDCGFLMERVAEILKEKEKRGQALMRKGDRRLLYLLYKRTSKSFLSAPIGAVHTYCC
jgi:hypothetical protein